jgi:divalent metal cation (Fe/Co/Zn/Cd) transporter
LQNPHVIKDPFWNYIVLASAFLFDGISFIVALKNFNNHRGKEPFWKAVKKSKDPTSFVVLFEDAADVLGLAVAFLGVYFGHLLQNPYFDGIASILIGLILTAVSIVLTRESRSLLMGETLSSQVMDKVLALANSHSAVENISDSLSMILGPEESLLILKPVIKKDLSSSQLIEAVDSIKKSIRSDFPNIKQIYIEPV